MNAMNRPGERGAVASVFHGFRGRDDLALDGRRVVLGGCVVTTVLALSLLLTACQTRTVTQVVTKKVRQ